MEPAGIYIRVSRLRDDDKSLSPETQRMRCEDLAHGKGFAVEMIESDLDESAYNQPFSKRPAFARLIDAVKTGRISAIIVARLDRFARRTADTNDVVRLLQKHRARLISGDHDVDIETAQGQFNLTLMASLAELESGKISERVKAGHRTRATKGIGLGGSAPMWAQYDAEPKSYTIIEPIADAFRVMAQMRAEGRGLTAIARALNTKGLVKASGATWQMTDIQRYMKDHWLDTMATGAQYYHRPSHRKYRNGSEIERPEPIRIENVYPSIIDVETMERATAVNARNRRPGAVNVGEAYLLAGIIHCQACGARMKGKATGGVRIYQCPNVGHPSHKGHQHLRCEMADDAVLRAVDWYVQAMAAEGARKPVKVDKATLQRHIRQIEQRIVRLNDMYELGSIDRADYVSKVADLKAEKSEAEASTREAPVMPVVPADPLSLPTATLRDILRQLGVKAEFCTLDSRITCQNGSLRPMVKVSYRPSSHMTMTGQMQYVCYAPIYRRNWQGKRSVYGDDELFGPEAEGREDWS